MLEAYEGTGSYTKEQRHVLISHLEDPEQRKHPWPAKLDVAFGIEDPEEIAAREAAAAAAAEVAAAAAAAAFSPEEGAADAKGTGQAAGGDGAESAASPKGGGGAASTPGGNGTPGGGRGRGGGGGRGSGGRFGGRGRRSGSGGKTGGTPEGMAAPAGGIVLLGSPMVDATLEDTQGLKAVIETLKREMGLSKGAGGGEGGGTLRMEVRGPGHASARGGVGRGNRDKGAMRLAGSFVENFESFILWEGVDRVTGTVGGAGKDRL